MENIDTKNITKLLKIDAKAVDIPIGAAEIFIEKTIKSTEKQLKTKKIIIEKDLDKIITKELKKYNPDLAYVYENRDRII